MDANLAVSEDRADDDPDVEADIPRTPGIECPDTDTVLSSPSIGRNGKSIFFETMAMRQPVTESQFPNGELYVNTCGLVFSAMGRTGDKKSFGELGSELGKHVALEVLGPLGTAAMSYFQSKPDAKRSLQHPDSFAIPAPAITAIHYGSLESSARRSLVLTCEDDEGSKATYTFVPKSLGLNTAGNLFWLMRFWFEFGSSHLDFVMRFIPEAERVKFMAAFYHAWSKSPADFDAIKQRLQTALPELGERFPTPETWDVGREQTIYRLQKFKRVKELKERYAVVWQRVESIDLFCFSCAQVSPPGSQQCRACGKALY